MVRINPDATLDVTILLEKIVIAVAPSGKREIRGRRERRNIVITARFFPKLFCRGHLNERRNDADE